MKLLSVMRARDAADTLMNVIQRVNFITAAIVLLTGGLSALSISVSVFCLAAALMSRSRSFRASPFSVIFTFAIWSYFAMPLSFIALLGDGYVFATGLADVPASAAEYATSAPAAVVFLTVCMLAVASGLIAGGARSPAQVKTQGSIEPDLPVGWIVAIVCVVTYMANQSYVQDTLVENLAHSESLLFWVFTDTTALLLAPIVYFSRLSYPKTWPVESTTKRFMFAIMALWAISIIGGSKGYVLVITNLAFVFPISYLKARRDAWVIVPSRLAVLIGAPVSVAAFAYSYILRFSRVTGGVVSAAAIASVSTSPGQGLVFWTLNEIAYRMSVAVDRFVLVYHSFVVGAFDLQYARDFSAYITKNFINLVMPGTPFPEAFSQSSNLFAKVLFHRVMDNDFTRTELLRSLNTQPYTLFGVMMILSGILAPVLVFMFSFAVARAYARTRRPIMAITLLVLFVSAIASYGPEVVVAESGHVMATLFAFLVILRWARRRNAKRPSRAGASASIIVAPAPSS